MHYKSHQSAIESNNSFAVKVEDLIREIVIQNDIPYYRIESGVEHHNEEGGESNFMPVIRVITYFEDTVNKISHILHDEFNVDIEKSVNKKKIRIETFAYKNINYTANLKADRQQQTVYKRSGDKKFEIQICSMLQDAWTGIEKELGYDTTAIPDEAKRDFYRVGALLEMADIEFLKIRTELAQKKNREQEEHKEQAAPAAVVEQPVVVASAPVVEEPIKAAEPVAAAPENKSNSFVEHLQSVAREVQKETVVARSEPVVEFTPPAPVYIPAPPVVVAAAPVVPPAPPVAETPMPAPVAEVAQPTPVAEPIAASVAEAVKPQPVAAPVVVPEPLVAPRPAVFEGIAPKATVVPKVESIAAGITSNANINIDSLKELAYSINQAEQKNNVVPEIPQPVVREEPKPVVSAPRDVVAETPKPVPAPEVIPPVAAKTIPLPEVQAYVPPVTPISTMNVSGSGVIGKTAEAAAENTASIYNQQAKKANVIPVDENAQMTDLTLRDYVMNSKLLKEVDRQIAERAGAKINADIDIEGDVERLRFLKVYSLKQLHDRITDNKDDIVAFAEKWIGKDNGGSFDSGISLFYLEYLLVGKKNDPAFAVEYVVKFISDNDYSARYIIPTYNSIHNTEAPNFSHLTLKA